MSRLALRAALSGALLLAVAIPAVAARRAHPAKPPVVTITTRDYAFDMPDTIAAGPTTLRIVSAGKELHHVQLIRLDEGKTFADFGAAMHASAGGPPPAWMHEVGGPNTPVPGGTSTTSLDLKPGNYVVLCFIPSADGTPHAMKGMVRSLTVVPAAKGSDVALPAPKTTITLDDYAFDIAQPLTAGSYDVLVKNRAAQAHEVLFVRLAPGKTIADFAAWAEKMDGPPPAAPIGGTTAMATGESNTVSLELTPGEYGLICFIPDAKDGKPHLMHGMVRQVSIK